jgi:O-Antigen ligase
MNRLQVTGIASVVLLYFVWPIAGTIALRNLLLAAGLGIFFALAWRGRSFRLPHGLGPALAAYALLSLWMLIVAFAISTETAWSLDELRGQWLTGLIALLIGLAAGNAMARDEVGTATMLTALALALAVLVAYVDFLALQQLPDTGAIGRRLPALGAGPDKANYVTNLLLAFLAAEIYLRLVHGRRALRLPRAAIAVLTFGALLAEYSESMRNGVAEFGLMFVLLAILLAGGRRNRPARTLVIGGAAALLLAAAAFAYLDYRSDARWQTLGQTAVVAWHTERSKAWLDPEQPLPLLADGSPVDTSAYLRITALKEGLLLVHHHPLGIGFGRNAYGHGLMAKYGDKGLGHSHSGLLDLAIGTGIPGIAIWLAFLALLFSLGWRGFRAAPDYASLLLLLVVGGYGFRMVADSVIRDHMLQQFLFTAGLLATLVASRPASRLEPVPAGPQQQHDQRV